MMDAEQRKSVRAKVGWGEGFHTSLRKNSDTDWSVLLWNMIGEVSSADEDRAKEQRVWSHFVAWCEERYVNGSEPPSKIVAAYTEAYDSREFPPELHRTRALPMLVFALRLCDAETMSDIDAAFAYVEDMYTPQGE